MFEFTLPTIQFFYSIMQLMFAITIPILIISVLARVLIKSGRKTTRSFRS